MSRIKLKEEDDGSFTEIIYYENNPSSSRYIHHYYYDENNTKQKISFKSYYINGSPMTKKTFKDNELHNDNTFAWCDYWMYGGINFKGYYLEGKQVEKKDLILYKRKKILKCLQENKTK